MRAVLVVILLWSGFAGSARSETFQAILADHWAWSMAQNPVYATALGERAHDHTLGQLSVASIDAATAQARTFAERLAALDTASLTGPERISHAILAQDLADQVEAGRFGQRLMLFTNRWGWHIALTGLPDDVPLFTEADFLSYISRLEDYPRYNAEGIATTRAAIKGGYTQPCTAMQGFSRTISAHIVGEPSQSVLWKPFLRKPDTIAPARWEALKARAAAAIRDQIVPAFKTHLAFYTQEYEPRCQRSIGARALPDGARYYAFRARQQTTTSLTPDAIHALGLREVARIRAEMDAVVVRSGFAGDRKGFVAMLRTDPRFYAKTPEELLAATAALMKTVDGEMPRFFSTLPRLPYTVKPIPAAIAPGNTTAYYEPGQMMAGRAGVYRVNTTALDQRPLFELTALSLHEAVPGHHHQIALAQELDLPAFRRYLVGFTAFIEGWGLYAERLGIDMGLYDDPYKDFGRLSYEMWRACRLVVDTGLHDRGWTREQAIAFMADNTALSLANIEAEVDRYITWPGQALAYKLGELAIRQLRQEAETALGARFDIRAFHDKVLENGAVPLTVLEDHVRRWIAAQSLPTGG